MQDASWLLESDAFQKQENQKMREGFPALPTPLTSTKRPQKTTGSRQCEGGGEEGWMEVCSETLARRQKNQSLLKEKKHLACHSPSLFSGGNFRMPGLQVPLLVLRELPIPKEKLQSIQVTSYCSIQYRFTKTMWSACSSDPVDKTKE